MLLGLLVALASAVPALEVDDNGDHYLDTDALEIREDIAVPGDFGALGIVNGTQTDGFDNVVSLAGIANWGGYSFCSGTLIDPNWILTAAHCVVEIPDMQSQGMDIYAIWGGDVYTGATDSRQMLNFYPHPDYNPNSLSNDIGLIELSQPKNGVDLAVLNDEVVDSSWIGQYMTFVGYGITFDNGDDGGIKRTTDIEVNTYTADFIESYTPGTNLCQGDSGGAAFENTPEGTLELAGVNSWVSPGCEGGSNGVTRVDKHVAWIQGYVPTVLLGGDGSGSNPGDGGGGGGGGGVDKGDASSFDRDLGAAALPTGGEYPAGCACDAGSGRPPTLGLFGLLILLGARRRWAA